MSVCLFLSVGFDFGEWESTGHYKSFHTNTHELGPDWRSVQALDSKAYGPRFESTSTNKYSSEAAVDGC